MGDPDDTGKADTYWRNDDLVPEDRPKGDPWHAFGYIVAGVAFYGFLAFIPLLGWANWLIIPLAVIGAAVGMASRSTAGRNLNLFVIVVGVLRLMLGGGIF